MLSNKLESALNDHINREVYSAYLYLAMSAYCESIKMSGAAHWLRSQAQEEWGHAMKIYGYVNDRGGRVVLKAIAEPPAEFSSLLDVFQQTLAHEKHVSEGIHKLYAQAVSENDYPTQTFLQWFINEQVEEEKAAQQIVDQLEMLSESKTGLIMMDRHLASRE